MSFFQDLTSTTSTSKPVLAVGQAAKKYDKLKLLMDRATSDQAQSNLNLAKQYSPQYAALMAEMMRTVAPDLIREGLGLGKQIQTGVAANNAAVANSAEGRSALEAAINADRTANPEFYNVRELEGQRLADLMNSIDLSGQLSGSETRSIDQYLGRANARAGTLNAPSNINTVKNATLYGDATYQRQNQAKNNLNQALNSATAFLPRSQSSVNSWETATGGSNTSKGTAAGAMGMFDTAISPLSSGANNLTSNYGNILQGFLGNVGTTNTQKGSLLSGITGASNALSSASGGLQSGIQGLQALGGFLF